MLSRSRLRNFSTIILHLSVINCYFLFQLNRHIKPFQKFSKPLFLFVRRSSLGAFDGLSCSVMFRHLTRGRNDSRSHCKVCELSPVDVYECLPPLLCVPGELAALQGMRYWLRSSTGRFLPSAGTKTPTHLHPRQSPGSNQHAHGQTDMQATSLWALMASLEKTNTSG